jgi:2-succinyl-5-enolpyruvyl-6-hydroxy-3-cyclohexene-1-carboxylate synthase
VIVVSPSGHFNDPSGRAASITTAVDAPDGEDAAWLSRWVEAGETARAVIAGELRSDDTRLSGPAVALSLAEASVAGDTLVVAASNAVRDLDLLAGAWPDDVSVVSNRGLAGIDGTISTAIGYAIGRGVGAVRVLIGDLAFVHDLNALLANGFEESPQVQIVLVNDGGGGIFELLEHGALAVADEAARQRFERVFGTAQRIDVSALCAGFGVSHHRVKTQEELAKALVAVEPGLAVIEVQVDRTGLRALHARITAAVGRAC